MASEIYFNIFKWEKSFIINEISQSFLKNDPVSKCSNKHIENISSKGRVLFIILSNNTKIYNETLKSLNLFSLINCDEGNK